HFVKNQEGSMLLAFLTQDGQEILSRKIKPSIRGNRFKDYSRDLISIFMKRLPHQVGIVERERNRWVDKGFRDAGAIRASMCQGATSRFHEKGIDMPVVTAIELNDFIASGESACQANA